MLHKTCQNILLLLVLGSFLWGAAEPTVSPTPALPTTTRGQTVTVMGENLPAQGVHVLLRTGKEGKGDKGVAIDAVVATDGKSLSFKLPKGNFDTGRYLVYVAFDSKELPVPGDLTVASGTLLGVGRYLKQQKSDVQIWAVEPPSGEMVDGLRNLDDGYVPPIFVDNRGTELLDRKVVVRPRESIEWTRRLTEVGLFVGISSGAIMAGAVKCADSVDDAQTATIVTVAPDDGWKYLSTGAWSDDLDLVVERAKKTIYF